MCALVAGTESNSRSAYGVDWYDNFIVRFVPLEYLGYAFNTNDYIYHQWYCLCTELALVLTCPNNCILWR